MLILMRGLLGVGKSTVAKKIAEKIDGTLVRTDLIRCELYPDPAYTTEEMQHVYDVFFQKVEEKLRQGENVVADTTSRQKRNIDRAVSLSKKYDTDFQLVEVLCNSDQQVKSRIEARNDGISKTNYQEYQKHKKIFEDVEVESVTIDNTGSIEETYQQIDQYFV